MTKDEIVEGLKLLEDNMVHFDELQNDKGEWIDVHELLFEAIQALDQQPSDTVSRGAFEQVMWERDVAIGQLKELGYELGQKIEPCDDAISREDAEQMFRNIRCHLKPQDYKSAEEFNTRDLMLLNAEQMIHALPSVMHKSGKWIPVSERLPEDEQEILFSTKTGRVHSGKYYDDDSANQWYSHKDKCRAWNNVVTAWMPLPKPYEPQESEEQTE